MKTACPLFLEDDSIEHLDWLAKRMSEKHNRSVSRSEAVEFLIRQHWKKMKIQEAKRKPFALAG